MIARAYAAQAGGPAPAAPPTPTRPVAAELVFTCTADAQAAWALHLWPTLLALGMHAYARTRPHPRHPART